MSSDDAQFDIDRCLTRAREGDAGAAKALAEAVYGDLRRIARRYMKGERPDHTLQPTALANEVYMRLFNAPFPDVASRDQFFVAAARAIRRILIEHARARAADKRVGDRVRVGIEDATVVQPPDPRDDRLVALDDALERLAGIDPTKARLVELRFYGGFSVAEAAAVLDLSERSAARAWRVARAFLESEIEEGLDDVDRRP